MTHGQRPTRRQIVQVGGAAPASAAARGLSSQAIAENSLAIWPDHGCKRRELPMNIGEVLTHHRPATTSKARPASHSGSAGAR